ncbi:MAG: YggT family protein [Chloroflexi bacterium]|nr:YggT family protein [Chloroflexota bacterium]
MSWFMPQDGSGISRVLFDITEPVLAPIRRVLPPIAGFDFSPILAIVLIQIISYALQQMLVSTA